MTSQEKAIARVMLTLTAITYRGINLILPEQLKRARLLQLMDDCMLTFSPVKDKWKIVWGPASFSAISPGLDDALVYVARNLEKPSQLAIAIRGTNPISVSDWIFGDSMVTRLVPWGYGNPSEVLGAAVSASTMIGLGILQHLTWSDEPMPASSSPSTATSGATPSGAINWSDLLNARLASEATSSIIQTLSSNARAMAGQRFNPLNLLRKQPNPAEAASGKSLKEFLASHLFNYPKADIYVAGHSKGGALSSTVALWLKDTQGPQATASELWDPQSTASVYCYTFAGPTAGNGAFSKHSDAELQANCVRVWNRLDVVPRAFVADAMLSISALYQLTGFEKDVVSTMIGKVADRVRPFGYRQICADGLPLDGTLASNLSFPLQVIHQHLDVYLQQFGLNNEMTAASLLAPVLP